MPQVIWSAKRTRRLAYPRQASDRRRGHSQLVRPFAPRAPSW